MPKLQLQLHLPPDAALQGVGLASAISHLAPHVPENLNLHHAGFAPQLGGTGALGLGLPMPGALGAHGAAVDGSAAGLPVGLPLWHHEHHQQRLKGQHRHAGPLPPPPPRSSHKADRRVSLHKWLCRPQRSVQPKESFWIFCEVLLLLEGGQGHALARPDGGRAPPRVRPSRMYLHSDGRVAFAEEEQERQAKHRQARHGHVTRPQGQQGQGQAGPGGSGPGPAAPGRQKPQLPPAAHAAGAGAFGGSGAAAAASKRPGTPPLAASAAGAAAVAAALSAGAAAAGVQPLGEARQADEAQQAQDQGQQQQQEEAEEEEELLYRSPEEGEGRPLTPQASVFSLGLLFFDLFHCCADAAARRAALQQLRGRALPPAFSRHQPKEAAFLLALLHPDPAARPSLAELLASDMFREACAALRHRHSSQAAAAAAAAAASAAPEASLDSQVLSDFLRTMKERKLAEVARVEEELQVGRAGAGARGQGAGQRGSAR